MSATEETIVFYVRNWLVRQCVVPQGDWQAYMALAARLDAGRVVLIHPSESSCEPRDKLCIHSRAMARKIIAVYASAGIAGYVTLYSFHQPNALKNVAAHFGIKESKAERLALAMKIFLSNNPAMVL